VYYRMLSATPVFHMRLLVLIFFRFCLVETRFICAGCSCYVRAGICCCVNVLCCACRYSNDINQYTRAEPVKSG
jgi:hypothetical protein